MSESVSLCVGEIRLFHHPSQSSSSSSLSLSVLHFLFKTMVAAAVSYMLLVTLICFETNSMCV